MGIWRRGSQSSLGSEISMWMDTSLQDTALPHATPSTFQEIKKRASQKRAPVLPADVRLTVTPNGHTMYPPSYP